MLLFGLVNIPIKSKPKLNLIQKINLSLFNTFINYHNGVLFCKNNNIKFENQNSSIITVKFNKTIYNFLYTSAKLDEIYIKYLRPTEENIKLLKKTKL